MSNEGRRKRIREKMKDTVVQQNAHRRSLPPKQVSTTLIDADFDVVNELHFNRVGRLPWAGTYEDTETE